MITVIYNQRQKLKSGFNKPNKSSPPGHMHQWSFTQWIRC